MPQSTTDWQSYLDRIADVSMSDLDALELELLGRKHGVLTDAMKSLGTLNAEEKKTKGQELNAWKRKIEEAIAERKSALMSLSLAHIAEIDRIDTTLRLPREPQGHLHLIP